MNQKNQAAERCLTFISKSPCCYQAVENIADILQENGFQELKEQEEWRLCTGGSYYVTRNGSSILSFSIPEQEDTITGFRIIASHSDSPAFKLKENPVTSVEDRYVTLNVEPYGGMIQSSWFDRSLSVAGRVVCGQDDTLVIKNINLEEDLLVIPNVAIHMNRNINKVAEHNLQTDLQPLFACGSVSGFSEKIARAAGVPQEAVLGSDLFVYVRKKGKLLGEKGEYMLSPRLDDLQCAYASLEGFLQAKPRSHIAVHAVFDNEEVGSGTRQGAASTFLKDTLERIGEQFGRQGGSYKTWLAGSFLISADNAHAVHPNHPEKADPTNRPYLNGGIVIKYHGGQKYTTDAYSGAVMKQLCKRADVPYQAYFNRSDMPGGSTLGNISATQVSVPSVDIGLAQLAMHSAVETAGSMDTEYLVKVSGVFFGE